MIEKVYIRQEGVESPSFESVDEQYEFAHKLAEIADNVSEDSYIEGKVLVPFCAPSDKEKVNGRFGEVIKNDERFVQFEDNETRKIVVSKYDNDSNGGVTLAEIQSVKGNVAFGKASITLFDEFRYFTGLTTLDGNVNGSGTYAFNNCSSLRSIALPSSIVGIGSWAFSGCTSLERIINIEQVTRLSQYAFSNTPALGIEVSLPNLTSIAAAAFSRSGVTKILNLGNITSTPTGSNHNSGYSIGVFGSCPNLESIVLPSTLTALGGYAANKCPNLRSVDFNHAACSIGGYSFHEDSSLVELKNAENVTSIGNGAFENCASLSVELNLPNLSGSIGSTAFKNSGITRITNLGSITGFVGNTESHGSFNNCQNLIYANLPSTLNNISHGCFRNNYKLEEVDLNGASCDILSYAFSNCTSLKRINGTENITSIASIGSFSYTALEEINLGKITSIGSGSTTTTGTLCQCKSLRKVVLPETCTSLGSYVFSDDNLLSEIDLRYVETFGRQTFSNCYALPIARLDSVVDAGTYLFSGGAAMSLKLCLIGENCVSVGLQSFNRCNHVKVVCKAVTPPTCGAGIFTYCSGNDYGIYVPDGSVDDYKATAGWSTYASRIKGFEEVDSFPSDADTSLGYLTESAFYYHNGEDWMMVDIETGNEAVFNGTYFSGVAEDMVTKYDSLTSDGISYLLTDIYPNVNNSYQIDFTRLGVNGMLFGCKTAWASAFYLTRYNNVRLTGLFFENESGGAALQNEVSRIGDRNVIDITPTKITLFCERTGLSYDVVRNYGTSTACSAVAMHLFGYNSNGTNNSNTAASIHGFKEYDADGVLVHNLVPAIFAAIAGMYDTVTEKFFVNAASEGSFTVSND